MRSRTNASPLHVRIPEPRRSRRSGSRRSWLRKFSFGLLTAFLVPLTLTATLIGASRLRPAAAEARGEARYSGTFGPTSARLVWSTLSNEIAQSPFYLAEADIAQAPVVALVSLSEPAEPREEPLVTGSLGGSLERAESLQMALPKVVKPERYTRPVANARLDADRPQPRAVKPVKQQLASLSPVEIGLPPQQEETPRKTAYYDITAKTVYLPNGERLEAHSGLGRYMDDPRFSKLKMRGVTPPNHYRLRERERLFHGVRAIRLLPEDEKAEKAMYGRDGILAHPYMLGSNGQSNGCVSFKHYDRFLQAYLRGEVERLVVVAKMDKPPVFAKLPIKSAANTR